MLRPTSQMKQSLKSIILLAICLSLSLTGLVPLAGGRLALVEFADPTKMGEQQPCIMAIATTMKTTSATTLPDYVEHLVIPFEPYNECDNRVLHLNCNTTIQVMHEELKLEFAPVLRKGFLCDQVLPQKNETREYTLPLCYQTPSQVGVIVQKTANWEIQLVLDISSSLPLPAQARILPLTRLVTLGFYYPDSTVGLALRDKDPNVGNIIWQYGAMRLLNPLTYTEVATSPDAAVMAMANMLNLEDNPASNGVVSDRTNWVSKFHVPTVVLGVGVQGQFDLSDDDNNNKITSGQNIQLSPIHHKFLSTVVERQGSTPAIGTRGDLTTLGCKSVGIQNCVSTGCPSLTIHRAVNLGATLRDAWERAKEKLRRGEQLNIGMAMPAIHSADRPLLYNRLPGLMNFTFNVASTHNVTIVLQMGYDLVNIQKFAQSLHRQDVKYSLKKYNSVQTWKADMAEMDIMLSMRIHGGMAAIMAGTPAIVIPTDLRIMELVNAMRIPFLTMDQIERNNPADSSEFLELLQNVNFGDFDDFEANRRDKIRIWKTILDTAGIEMDPSLLRIIQNEATQS